MTKILRGLRGATTATANTSDAILEATQELLAALQTANGFAPEDVESAIFTTSPDLDADYPARAARRLGWTEVPLLGAAEVAVRSGLPPSRSMRGGGRTGSGTRYAGVTASARPRGAPCMPRETGCPR